MPPLEVPSSKHLLARLIKLLRFYQAVGMKELLLPQHVKELLLGDGRGNSCLDAAPSLETLKLVWGDCRRCQLYRHRHNLVFGEGHPQARLVFVGEAPGEEEDLQGRPFVGKAGRLLTDIIVKGLKLARSQVYITNIVKCRPPGNRDPEPQEIRTCKALLWRQLRLIQPRVVCALGRVAAQALLDSSEPITVLRGSFHQVGEFKVMPTFHPAYLLRNPEKKKQVWEDLKAIMRSFPDLKPGN